MDINEKILVKHAKMQTVAISLQGNFDNAMNEAVVWNKYSKKGEKTEMLGMYKALNAQNMISPQMIPTLSAPSRPRLAPTTAR